MKKFAALFIALMMLVMSVSAFADTVVWSDYADRANEIDPNGEFCAVADLGIMMWYPSDLQIVELTQEQVDEGLIGYLTNDEGTAYVSMNLVDLDGLTMDDMLAYLPENGMTSVLDHIINDLRAISFIDNENDFVGLLFGTTDGNAVAFYFAPASDENYRYVSAIMAASIQVIPE